jgi:phosphoribosylanthranilate isomerase
MALPVRIKICGVRTADVARAAVDAGADMIGLVFAEKSPRYVTAEQAAAIVDGLGPRVDAVGVFKDAEPAHVKSIAFRAGFSIAQLHGETGEDAVAAISPLRAFRAIAFDPATIDAELERWSAYFKESRNLLSLIIDTPDPSRLGGGTGKTFDWAALRAALDRVKPAVPIVLAGGLTPENVAEAVGVIRPWAVDVSSGVESSRGVKDISKVRAFCDAARRA